jgi:phosphoglycerate dehydrogenase-like enzyme
MNIVLLQVKLSKKEIQLLFNEFPNFLYLSTKELPLQQWPNVEIIFGDRLTAEELNLCPQLRWIHSPNPHLKRICTKEIVEKGTVLITTTKEENLHQIGEYVMGGILAFAKNLFHWQKADQDPRFIWDSKWRDSMWTLQNKQLLQVGLGPAGTEIARQARHFGLKITGADQRRSFHPYCHTTHALEELPKLLPEADIVCLSLPITKNFHNWFTMKELELMKEDSILIVIGSGETVNEDDLFAISQTGKLRGVMIDAFYQIPIPPTSPLWKIENIIITPEVSPRPKSEEKLSFQLFRYNLRQYISGNFSDMRNVIEETAGLIAPVVDK